MRVDYLGRCSHFWPNLPLAANMAGMSFMLLSSPVFWLGLILVPATALLSDLSLKTLFNTLFKSFTDQVRRTPQFSLLCLFFGFFVLPLSSTR